MNESIGIAKKAGKRVAHFLKSVKSQTRDLSPRDHYVFNAVEIINDTILLLNHSLYKNNCPVSFNPVKDVIELYGSRERLSQIITNLLTNAIDAYKDKGGGPIIVELLSGSSGINLLVKDKGSGINKDDLKRIFDPMFTTKSLEQGTGLGLTIVHNIITGDFGGSIKVDSKVDEGTTFNLYFPLPLERLRNSNKV